MTKNDFFGSPFRRIYLVCLEEEEDEDGGGGRLNKLRLLWDIETISTVKSQSVYDFWRDNDTTSAPPPQGTDTFTSRTPVYSHPPGHAAPIQSQ